MKNRLKGIKRLKYERLRLSPAITLPQTPEYFDLEQGFVWYPEELDHSYRGRSTVLALVHAENLIQVMCAALRKIPLLGSSVHAKVIEHKPSAMLEYQFSLYSPQNASYCLKEHEDFLIDDGDIEIVITCNDLVLTLTRGRTLIAHSSDPDDLYFIAEALCEHDVPEEPEIPILHEWSPAHYHPIRNHAAALRRLCRNFKK